MSNAQLTILCACILSTSVIDLLYREFEKAPIRKAAREAQAAKTYQEEWAAAKSGLLYFHQACRDYFNSVDGKKGDIEAFHISARLWLSPVTRFVDAYPKSLIVETTLLSKFVPQVQPALTAPSDESIRAAWVLSERVCKQLSIQ